MTGYQLARHRKKKKWTQVQTARALCVSQTYLSLLESGKRRLSERVEEKVVRFFDLPPTDVPARAAHGEVRSVSDDQLASDLADLGYQGFSHLKRKRARRKNPADVLLSALNAPKRDARLVEALPWLLLSFPYLEWDEVSRVARMHDLQNRLGYLTNVARRLAEREGRDRTCEELMKHEAELKRSLLAREDTLCNESMTQTERKWLADNRSEEAKDWHLLTDLSPRNLNYV